MDNNRNLESFTRINENNKTKQLLLDPNAGNENVPIENLSIECDLSVYDRPRSFIGVEYDEYGDRKTKIAELKDKKVPFNQGTKFGDDFSLSTDYTRVSENDYDGTETLGITSINIEYNSSYMPIITIELTDIRGKLFQQGKDGPYSPFFNFPYPLFELKIKGYFGKPVVYLLHMTKFTSKMDSENGNFQVTCSFTGYTYAYLSDMLIGYLKAVPYTTIGRSKIAAKKLLDPSFVSFDELYEFARTLNEEIVKLKTNDKELRALALGHKIADELLNIRNTIIGKMKSFDNSGFKAYRDSHKFVFLKKDPDVNIFDQSVEVMEKYMNTNLVELITEYNQLAKGSSYLLNTDLVKTNKKTNFFTTQTKSFFIEDNGEIKDPYYGGIERFRESQENIKDFNEVVSVIKTMDVGEKEFFDIIYLKDIINEIDTKLKTLREQVKNGEGVKGDDVIEKLRDLKITDEDGNTTSFDFNLKNYVKVLADHVDILMETIEAVSKKAEDSDERNTTLLSKGGLYDLPKGDFKRVFGFPDYKVKKDGEVFTDEWIGEDFPDIEEVLFIQELQQGIIEAQKNEEIFETQLEEINTQWYGVNPFDNRMFTDNTNPWAGVANSSGADGKILRLLGMRAIIFLGLTIKNPQPDEITAMAKLEAHNLFRTLINSDAKHFMVNLGNDTESIANRIRGFINKSNPKIKNKFESLNKNNILRSDKRVGESFWFWETKTLTDYEDYIYLGGHATSTKVSDMVVDNKLTDGARFFLPLYFKGNSTAQDYFQGDAKFFDKDGDFISNEARKDLRKSGDIFFGDYMGSHVSGNYKPDVGATYIQLINPDAYNTLNVDVPKYGNSILEKVTSNSEWDYNSLGTQDFKNILFKGKFHTNEFMSYKRNGNSYRFFNYFYKNEMINETPPLDYTYKVATGLNPNSALSINEFSVFGSKHYYAQTDLGRAYLFLHSLPFNIVGGDIFHKGILNLFDEKASIIQIPRVWALYLGSIFYRELGNELLTIEKDGIRTVPSSSAIVLPPLTKITAVNEHLNTYSIDEIPTKYNDLGSVLSNLPISVKKVFRDEFADWVIDGEFKPIQEQLEIYNTKSPTNSSVIDLLLSLKETNRTTSLDNSILSPNFKNNYNKIDKTSLRHIKDKSKTELTELLKTQGDVLNFNLELKSDGLGYALLKNLFNEEKLLINSTWRIWANDLERSEKLPGNTYPITFRTDNFDLYLTSLVKEFKTLVKDFGDDDLRRSKVFGTTNMGDIYLTMYKNIKSINDKWISGENSKIRSSFDTLINSFRFIDRGYNDIGTAFMLNPMHVTTLLKSNYNTSFYAHISKVLTKNNFDFIPMPNYVDLRNESTLEEVFETNGYNEDVTSSTSSFVCMYIGEKSSRLEVGDNFAGDGMNFGSVDSEIPDDFDRVPAFLVRYGDQNQSIFKSIELDQSEFSETNESLMTTDQIASSYNNINSVGQNIFDVFNNRAYNANIEMMGNAMIQPFMYFQLDNIPMFRGGYVITKVTHKLTPNHMITNIKGNRVKFVKTRLLNKEAIFFNMIGDFSDIQIGDVDFDDFKNVSERKRVVVEGIGGPALTSTNKPVITAEMTNPEIYLDSYRIKNGSNPDSYDNPSNTQKNGVFMTYNEIMVEVSQLTGVPLLTLQVMSVMESAVGAIKGPNGLDMNKLGYTGLMQFGRTAAIEVVNRGRLNEILFGKSDFLNYSFHGNWDTSTKKVAFPSDWIYDPTYSVNNKDTNSFFDDYVSILAGAILAKLNVRTTSSALSNVADIYLAHQQGAGGLRNILRNPTNKINGNASGNMPPFNKTVEYNQEWYLAWAAHVEATGKALNSDYEIIVGKGIV